MSPIIKYSLVSLLIIPVVLLLIVFIWAGIQYLFDPLDFIDQTLEEHVIHSKSVLKDDFLPKERIYHEIVLKSLNQSEIRFLISKPEDIPEEGLPIILILGGLEVGKYTLKYIPEPGNNIIISYQYPYHPEYWYQGSVFEELPLIRSSVLNVPTQVLSLIKWIDDQEWAAMNKITVTGYSFGALFVPAIYRLASQHDFPLRFGVIAYGGVNIYQLMKTNMTTISQPFRSVFSLFGAVALRGIEPAFHVPHMRAELLVINGAQDHQIPEESWRELHRLIPEPKTIVILEEGHMHPRKIKLTQRLVKLSHKWLISKEMANP